MKLSMFRAFICYTYGSFMNESVYDDLALEEIAKQRFGLSIDIESVILRHAPVSRTAYATVYLTKKKQLYVHLTAQSNLTLGDVKKFINRMGLKPELFLPPKGQPNYFDEVGRAHFVSVFPGRSHISSDDLTYYRTLAPYNPALIQINEIPSGEIRQFDTDAHGQWRVGAKFAYRRIRTS